MPESQSDRSIIPTGATLPDGLVPDFGGFTFAVLERDFNLVKGAAFVSRFQVLDGSGVLDVPAVASRVPVDVSGPRRDFGSLGHARLYGAAGGGWRVDFDARTPEPHIPFILGHEIGHIVLFGAAHCKGLNFLRAFISRCDTDPLQHQRVEAFCEFFSGKLQGWIS